MNNTEFIHFDWGIHSDESSSYYALASPSVNKFYLVGQDYGLLKEVQFIAIASRHLVMVNLSNLPNYAPTMIDNSVCMEWAVNSPIGTSMLNGLAGDYKMRNIDSLVNHQSLPTADDIELQKNLLFILMLLKSARGYICRQISQTSDVSHNIELTKFFKITLPNDIAILDMIALNQNLAVQAEELIAECYPMLVRALSTVNFSVPHTDVVDHLKTIVSTDPAFAAHYGFKQFIMTKL